MSDSMSVGPFKEGDPLTIQCVAVGGEPPPSVLWYRDNTIIDKTYIANEKGAVQNTLTIQRLDRSDMGPRYRCLASNNNMTLPTQTWITLDIMCKSSRDFITDRGGLLDCYVSYWDNIARCCSIIWGCVTIKPDKTDKTVS